jgi:hypothetical protein
VVDRREAEDVVLHDRVRLDLVEDLAEPLVDVAGAVAECPPGRLDELGELLDRRLTEDRRRLSDGSRSTWPIPTQLLVGP